jgi:hypothetical protein
MELSGVTSAGALFTIYKGIVAGILSARAANLSVNLNVFQDGNGYCQIGYIAY